MLRGTPPPRGRSGHGSDSATALETYLAAIPASGRAAADFSAIATSINAAYGTLAISAQQAETTLPIYDPTAGAATDPATTSTPATFRATLDAATQTAGAAINAGLVGGGAGAATGPIQAQLTDTAPTSLISRFDASVVASSLSEDSWFFLNDYKLLDLELGSALAALYNATAIEAYLAAKA